MKPEHTHLYVWMVNHLGLLPLAVSCGRQSLWKERREEQAGTSQPALPLKFLCHYYLSTLLPPFSCFVLPLLIKLEVPRPLFSTLWSFFLNTLFSVTSSKPMASTGILDFQVYSQSLTHYAENIYSTACLASLPRYHTGTLDATSPVDLQVPFLRTCLSAHPTLVYFQPHQWEHWSFSLTSHSDMFSRSPGLWLPPKYFSNLFPHSHSHWWHLNPEPLHCSPGC